MIFSPRWLLTFANFSDYFFASESGTQCLMLRVFPELRAPVLAQAVRTEIFRGTVPVGSSLSLPFGHHIRQPLPPPRTAGEHSWRLTQARVWFTQNHPCHFSAYPGCSQDNDFVFLEETVPILDLSLKPSSFWPVRLPMESDCVWEFNVPGL